MPNGIPPHEQLITHEKLPVHASCIRCECDLYGVSTEYTQYAGVVFNWPEAWCPKCGTPQYVDMGELTRSLGPIPSYDPIALMKRLRQLTSKGPLSPEHIVKHFQIQIHKGCVGCGYDLHGLATEYYQYAGIIADPPEVKCPECGEIQKVDLAGNQWRFHAQIIKEILAGTKKM